MATTTDAHSPGRASIRTRTAEPRTAKSRTAKPRTAKTRLGGLAVVCARCAKRQGLRPKVVRALLKDAYKELRAEGDGSGGTSRRRKLCVVESGCLGPCPKRAVALATGASLAAGRVLLLDPEAGMAGARAALLPEFGPNAGLAEGPTPAGAGDDPSRSP